MASPPFRGKAHTFSNGSFESRAGRIQTFLRDSVASSSFSSSSIPLECSLLGRDYPPQRKTACEGRKLKRDRANRISFNNGKLFSRRLRSWSGWSPRREALRTFRRPYRCISLVIVRARRPGRVVKARANCCVPTVNTPNLARDEFTRARVTVAAGRSTDTSSCHSFRGYFVTRLPRAPEQPIKSFTTDHGVTYARQLRALGLVAVEESIRSRIQRRDPVSLYEVAPNEIDA